MKQNHATMSSPMLRAWKPKPSMTMLMTTSLPAPMRRETLLKMFRSTLDDHVNEQFRPTTTWQHQYKVMGCKVCLNAFCLITGIGRWSLTKAREGALHGQCSSLANGELPMHLAITPASKPNLHIDARTWLVCYAEAQAESSPMKLELYLPAGRKRYYYELYAYERKQQGKPACELALFYRMWRHELPFICICKSHSMFTRCGCCEYLRMQIDMCPRDNDKLLAALKERLGAHFQFQSAQRLAEAQLEERCCGSGGKMWFMHIGLHFDFVLLRQSSAKVFVRGAMQVTSVCDPPGVDAV